MSSHPGRGAAPFAAHARRRLVRFEPGAAPLALDARPAAGRRAEDLLPRGARPHARQALARGRHRRGAVPVPAGAGARGHARRGAAVHDADAGHPRAGRSWRTTSRPARHRPRSATRAAPSCWAARRRAASCSTTRSRRIQCYVAPFRIDAGLVTNAQYAEFVADGGYQNGQFWSVGGQRVADAAGALVAALLAARRRPVAHDALRPAVDAGRVRAGAPRLPVRGAGLLRVGRPAPADRSGVGVCGRVGAGGLSLGPAVGVDRVAVRAASGLRGRTATANIRSRGS